MGKDQAIQVTKSLSDPEVKKREMRGLLEGMHTHQLSEGVILTMDEEQLEEIHEGQKITILPAWKWLLSDVLRNG